MPTGPGPTSGSTTPPIASRTCWSTDLGLVPGSRVLLRGANHPMLVACWFAVLKAGGVAVTTMPLLRARELGEIIEQAAGHALR